MCGFFGAFSSEALSEQKLNILADAGKNIVHRGPDSQHTYANDHLFFYFARLSILDTRSESDQPMISSDGNLVLMFNGEIYNYKQIRTDLEKLKYKFQTSSDTEVILNGFQEWGPKIFASLRGMFSIIIWSKREDQIIIARDQLGIKPLFWVKTVNQLYFCSELKPLLNFSSKKLNLSACREYFSLGTVLNNETLVEDIFEIHPGNYVKINRNLKMEVHSFYDLSDSINNWDENKKIDLLEAQEVINESISLHTCSDVGWCSHLSGGLDSSYISAFLSSIKPSIDTFSVQVSSHSQMDESKYQIYVSNKFKTNHHTIPFNIEQTSSLFYESLRSFQLPLHHPNIIPSFVLNEEIKKSNEKVALSGDGADEIFFGYNWQFNSYQQNEDIIDAMSFVPISKTINLFNSNVIFPFEKYNILLQKLETQPHRIAYLSQASYLKKWLYRQDICGMRNSVEIRTPFADVKLFDYFNNVSIKNRTKDGQIHKYILKKISKKYFSSDFIHRNKIGFALPLEDWFREKLFQDKFEKCLSNNLYGIGIFNISEVCKIWKSHQEKIANNGRIIWMILNFAEWYRELND